MFVILTVLVGIASLVQINLRNAEQGPSRMYQLNASFAIDGDYSSYAYAAGKDPYIAVEFDKSYMVNTITVTAIFFTQFDMAFTDKVSGAGSCWNTETTFQECCQDQFNYIDVDLWSNSSRVRCGTIVNTLELTMSGQTYVLQCNGQVRDILYCYCRLCYFIDLRFRKVLLK